MPRAQRPRDGPPEHAAVVHALRRGAVHDAADPPRHVVAVRRARRTSARCVGLLLRKDQGLIMLTGHYGNWEILGYVLATLGFETDQHRPAAGQPVRQRLAARRPRAAGPADHRQEGRDDRGHRRAAARRRRRLHRRPERRQQRASSSTSSAARPARTSRSACWRCSTRCRSSIGYARRVERALPLRGRRAGHHLPDDWKDAGRPAAVHHAALHARRSKTFVREDPGQYLWVHRRGRPGRRARRRRRMIDLVGCLRVFFREAAI